MNLSVRTLPLLSALALALPAAAAPNDAVAKPVKTVVQAVRYSKDDMALKHFASEEQGRLLLGEEWSKGTDAQRAEFIKLFQSLFSKIAFPKVRANFKNLVSMTYADPAVEGEQAKLGSTIVIEHELKKQELKVEYAMVKDKGAWKVLDVAVLGDSMLKGIREEQIKPIMQDGGWDNLLKLMREKEAELKGAKK
jgi:phospholipid transport system substrate-binding protein